MSIQVTACLNPFTQERTEYSFDSGITINEIIKKIDALQASNTGWRVMIDDEIITDFERIPEEGQRVYVKIVPEGDSPESAGNGMKAGGALIAVIGVILCFTPAAGLGAMLIGTGVGLFAGGMVLHNIDIPNMNDREKPEQDPSIRGSRNQMRPYGVLPVLFGRRRIYADQCANPFTWVEPSDGSIWLYQLFCVGQKDLQIETETFKIEETLLKDYSATGSMAAILNGTDSLIQMQIAYGGNSSPLYDKCVHEIQLNTLLKHQTDEGLDGAIVRTTPDGTTELNVDIFFYSGLGKYNDDGDVVSTSVEVKAEYKLSTAPDSAYQLLGYFSNGSNVISGSELKTKRLAITKSNLSAAAYTVRVTRISADSSDSKIIDTVYVGSIRAAKNESPVRAERCAQITQIGLKIKASEKLNNIIEQLNFVAQSIQPVCHYGQWTDELSSNPASAAMYAMQGEMSQQKLIDSDIDKDSFSKLYNWCAEHEYECNAYVCESMSINELLSRIASTCRSEIFRINGKITVVQDIARDSYVQLFTPRNSHDYKETMALADVPDELKMGFTDKDSGFAENEAHVYNTPTGNKTPGVEPETSQNVPLWGVTSYEQALKLGMYNYAVSNHRFLVAQFSCDFEYLMCRKGDWIKYAGDIALAGITQGRIVSILQNDQDKIIGFECDEEIPMAIGNNYSLRVRKSNGSALFNLINSGETSRTVYLQTPVSASDLSVPNEGDLFTFGIRGQDAKDYIITDIQCGEGLTADLTCVEYAPEIFGIDDPNFVLPDFENKLSETSGAIDRGNITQSDWKTFFTYHDGEEEPDTPFVDGTSEGWHHTKTTESVWVSSKISKSIYEGEWSAPAYARGPRGEQGDAGYNIQILSSAGTVFKNGTGTTTLTAHIYQGKSEIDVAGTQYQYRWKKYDAAGNLDPDFTATTKSITVAAGDVDNKSDYEVEVN